MTSYNTYLDELFRTNRNGNILTYIAVFTAACRTLVYAGMSESPVTASVLLELCL